jgi:fused signal recognition particle receptor
MGKFIRLKRNNANLKDLNDDDVEKPKKWFKRLKSGLQKSRQNLVSKLSGVFSRFSPGSEEFWEEVEEILIQADLGVKATARVVDNLCKKAKEKKIQRSEELLFLLAEALLNVLSHEKPIFTWKEGVLNIFLIVGVNGTGKTTSLAKIGYRAKMKGKKVLIAAADTFRAAAIEQLEIWAKRVDIDVIKHKRGSDPAAVVFDAVQAALARSVDLLLVDTAGRLHTYTNLMEELKKIKRVAQREAREAEIRTILVVDATTGQNALSQARLFNKALEVDEMILTKLDGTAKGGIVVAIFDEIGIPITLIGVGEQLDDLQDFKPRDFVEALLAKD